MQSLYDSNHIPIQITNAQEVSKDIENYLKQADSYFYDGNDSIAISIYDKVLTIDPKNVNATVMKGASLSYLGLYKEAMSWLTRHS